MRQFRTRTDDATFDLNLAPMLDIIVSIVPMLLLSTVFLHITVIETPIPQAVARALASDREKEHHFNLTLYASNSGGFKLVAGTDGKEDQTLHFNETNKTENFEKLHAALVQIKQVHPDHFRLEFHPSPDLSYDQIIRTLDTARNRYPSDPQIFLNDGGKQVAMDLMFPDVVFANVSGG